MTRRSTKASAPKPYHHGNLRQALVDAALAIVLASGPDAVSIREAARRAGVSPGAPFRHFADKTALMVALAEEGLRRLEEAQLAAMAVVGDDPLEQFRALGVSYVVFAANNPAHFRVMNVPEYASGEHSSFVRETHLESQARVNRLLEAAKRSGQLRDGSIDAIRLTASTTVYGAARMFVDGNFARMGIGPERAEWVARSVTELLGSGFATTTAPKKKKPAARA